MPIPAHSASPAQRFHSVLLRILLATTPTTAIGNVTISEIHAAPNDRVLQWNSQGAPRLGVAPHWQEQNFPALHWLSGNAPLGVGASNTTDLTNRLLNKTPSFFVRKTFQIQANQLTFGDLRLRISYDDGFVAYLNGKEVTRANMGPAKQMPYASMITYRVDAPSSPVEYALGPIANSLVEGTNVLAVQVHNNTLAGNSRFDAQLVSVLSPVTGTLTNLNFNNSNNAIVTHQVTAGTLNTSSSGTPPPDHWAGAPAPAASAAWQDLSVKVTASSADGIQQTGGVKYDISQSGPDAPLLIHGQPMGLAPFLQPGTLTTADLAKLTFSCKFLATPGALFGMKFSASSGGPTLGGFGDLSTSGPGLEDPTQTYANSAAAYRRKQINSTGTQIDLTTGSPANLATLFAGPAMRGLGTGGSAAEFRLHEDNTAGAGAGGSTGALRMAFQTQPVVWDYFGFAVGGLTVRSWPNTALLASHLSDLTLNFAWKSDAGQVFSAYLEPTNGGYADRLDLGTLTGNGSWVNVSKILSDGGNTAAFLSKINAATVRTFRLAFRRDTALANGVSLWVDNVGFASRWQNYSVTLNSGSPADQAAFIAALNSNGGLLMPSIEKKSTAPSLPDSQSLIIDDVKLDFNGQPTATPQTFISYNQPWQYWPGLAEPSGGLVEPALFPTSTGREDFSDWLELHNPTIEPLDLGGWHLTDDPTDPQKFTLPANTFIQPNGYLVILADAPTTPIPGAVYIHANFKLSSEDGYLALSDASGSIVAEIPDYGKQFAHYTYGLDPANGVNYRYLTVATPGAPNSTSTLEDHVRTPDFSLPGGFLAGTQSLTLTCETTDAVIRYTLDGSDPSETSPEYTGAISLPFVSAGNGHCVRIRAFKPGWVPSGTKTRTFLINQDANLKTGPALVITGDPQRSLFDPFGITAIDGGVYTSGVWSANSPAAYNNANADGAVSTSTGQGWERPVELELFFPDGRDGFRQTVGIRISGSPHARPRYVLNTITNAPWSYTSSTEKPSLNLFFRSDWDKDGLDYPILGDTYSRKSFESLRLRAGKNDVRDPFVRDEYARRLMGRMGHATSWGTIFPLYVNGKFRGYYNAAERLREEFMQAHFGGKADWDVRYIADMVDGDAVAFTDFVARLTAYGAAPTDPAKLQAVVDVVDQVNAADYFILNAWLGTGDWPHNNYTWSRERTPTGKWRLFVWDAEGAFGGFSKHLAYNVFTQDLLASPTGTNREIAHLYTRLKNSTEFRLLMADRVNKHFCNDGALSDASLTSNKNDLINMLQPIFTYTGGGALNQSFFTSWVNPTMDKRDVLFRNFNAPVSSYATDPTGTIVGAGGTHGLTAGAQITITGSSVAAYNGTFTVSAVAATTFTIPATFTSDPGAGNRGTWKPSTTELGYQLCRENIWPARMSTGGTPALQGTWQAPLPPQFSQHGGNVPQGYLLGILHTDVADDRTISNPYLPAANQSPASRITYYTTNGSDPRLPGGAVSPSAITYTSPVLLNRAFVTVKSRIRNTANSEWSPLTEATFTVAADQPSATNLVVAEIMYHPSDASAAEITAGFTDKDDFEFIRLQNISTAPVDLRALQFIDGVDFDFATSAVPAIDPGGSVLVVSKLAAFTQRYGTAYSSIIAGEFGLSLRNQGETIHLRRNGTTALTLRLFTFDDAAPWPEAADGSGASLILINPTANPDHAEAAHWTSSALPGGLFALTEQANYDRWRHLSFSPLQAANPAISDPNADADADGYDNLLEFALAMDPNGSQQQAPQGGMIQHAGLDYLSIQFRRPNNTTGITIAAQTSPDMLTWSPGMTGVALVSSTPHPDGSTTYIYRDTQPQQSDQKRFIRLLATQP